MYKPFSILAASLLFLGGSIYAEAGILFTEYTISKQKQNLTIVQGSFKHQPGGFWAKLNGGHRFWYKKSANKAIIHFDQKLSDGTFRRFSGNIVPGFTSYTTKAGKKRFLVTKNFKLSLKVGQLHHSIWIKKGSVLSK